jgi:hypothetical protein
MKTLLSAVLLSLLAGCGLVAAPGDLPVSISLERTGCYGSCPSYLVTLRADGTVTFEGREHVESKGQFQKKIDPAKLAPLFAKVEAIHFWDLKDRYVEKVNADGTVMRITDLPTRYTEVKYSTRAKRIKNYFDGPAGLEELEHLIDEVAGVSAWIGKAGQKIN